MEILQSCADVIKTGGWKAVNWNKGGSMREHKQRVATLDPHCHDHIIVFNTMYLKAAFLLKKVSICYSSCDVL